MPASSRYLGAAQITRMSGASFFATSDESSNSPIRMARSKAVADDVEHVVGDLEVEVDLGIFL